MEKPDEMAPPKQAVIPHPMVLGNPPQNNESSGELCGWGPQCPICVQSTQNLKAEDSKEEDWNGDEQKSKKEDQLERNYYPSSPQYSPSYDFPDRLPHHYRTEEERKERLEFFNDKYNLDYYSDSNTDSEHKYETFV